MGGGDFVILVVGGFAAGVINTLAGGGSLISVGLLVFLGLPGTVANGTNRIGVLVQNVMSAWRFRAEGVSGFRHALPLLVPLVVGSLIGAYGISRITPAAFEKIFGIVMLGLLVPMLRPSLLGGSAQSAPTPWSPAVRTAVFFAIGVYGGAIQAGVSIFLVFALSRGSNLVLANSIKAVVNGALTAVAIPVFILSDQVLWPEALALAVGFGLGGAVGARIAVRGGERVIRPVLVLSVIALAANMLGIF